MHEFEPRTTARGRSDLAEGTLWMLSAQITTKLPFLSAAETRPRAPKATDRANNARTAAPPGKRGPPCAGVPALRARPADMLNNASPAKATEKAGQAKNTGGGRASSRGGGVPSSAARAMAAAFAAHKVPATVRRLFADNQGLVVVQRRA